MLFNSLDFVYFLIVVFVIYWILNEKKLNIQNAFLLIASYFFYGWWDYRFLALLFLCSLVDFIAGQKIDYYEDDINKRKWLIFSVVVNLGILSYFKYANFFIDSFVDSFSFLGIKMEAQRLSIILPVGISFYTFQTLSYTIDIYRNKLKPTRDPIAFFTFVSFFPQLVAGPIERATNLLPQVLSKRRFIYENATSGLRQILWGFFKKLVIADNCAIYVDQIFNHTHDYTSFTLIVGPILFAVQIYCDFSGYSDIAIGTAKLFGFNLMQNFNFPYFSRNIGEFWRKWHISLSTWFRDYLYIPLGGSKGSKWKIFRNVLIIFVVSGFWHGANWTFIVWGALNGLLFLPLIMSGSNRKYIGRFELKTMLDYIISPIKIASTFSIVCLGWIFFRSATIYDAFSYISNIFQTPFKFSLDLNYYPISLSYIIIGLFVWEWFFKNRQFGLDFDTNYVAKPLRWGSYIAVLFLIITYGVFDKHEFIYFAF